MFSVALIKALQVYGIAIALSLLIAVLIKVMVVLTGRVNKPAVKAAPVAAPVVARPAVVAPGIPGEVIAAISAAVATLTGPHRILHIGESSRAWASEGRIAQHSSHQPRH